MGDTVFKPDFARNSVLDQQYKGETIKPGASIQQGSSITLVLGSGIGGQEYGVPDLIGLTYLQARARLDSMGLSLGSVTPDPDVRDSSEAYIYKQNPPQFGDEGPNHIHMGQSVGIWLRTHKPVPGGDSASPAPGAY